ncbi:3-hydroxylacyl-ACP dehydratase [Pseudoalteromonas rubra]|uniref:ApeP family dehydratase n=1 Tax=Pseudoalteromonas rubra TaxID=43658 RepID=UPI000F7A67A5|nr:3-hydroxylacyl-ACP dehydratase [Pseudoalteromonas rubra]
MRYNSHPIESLLAHREPMILIDKLIAHEEDTAECSVEITSDSLFLQAQGVPSYIGIEYMAQAIAAFAGAKALARGEAVEVGFLLGSRKYQTSCPFFKLGVQLTIMVKELHREESGLGVFECQILEQERLLASAKVNVFQPKDPESFIRSTDE